MSEFIVVTRHPALVEYLVEAGYISASTEVVSHASEETVAGKHVFGVLPLRLAALAASITEVPLDLPPQLRGVELTIEQVRQYAGKPTTYVVKETK
jgi:hypothetical protein